MPIKNNKTLILHSASFLIGVVAVWMLYEIGGWKLPLAMILFGWSMNIQNLANARKDK